MNYINKYPTIAGWYWIDSIIYQGIVHVFHRPNHKHLCIRHPEDCSHTKRNYLYVSQFPPDTRWSGPIEEPQDE
jgi:hypothetical protein